MRISKTQGTILGIDPGVERVGFALIQYNMKILDYGVIKTKKKDLAIRIWEIHEALKDLIQKYAPTHAAVEEIFFYNNMKTAVMVSQARGAILLTLAEAGIPIEEYTPLQVKQSITGYGAADKKQMQKMIQILFKLKELPKSDDAADALAIALTSLHYQKYV